MNISPVSFGKGYEIKGRKCAKSLFEEKVTNRTNMDDGTKSKIIKIFDDAYTDDNGNPIIEIQELNGKKYAISGENQRKISSVKHQYSDYISCIINCGASTDDIDSRLNYMQEVLKYLTIDSIHSTKYGILKVSSDRKHDLNMSIKK